MPESELYRKIRAEAAAQRRAAPRRGPSNAIAARQSPIPPAPTPADLRELTIAELAAVVARDWAPVRVDLLNPASPYLRELANVHTRELLSSDPAAVESARSHALYFLSNAGTWRGPTARVVKAELRRRIGA